MKWARVPLQKVAMVAAGFGFPREYQGATDEEYPFLKVGDMNLPGNEVEMRYSQNTVSAETLSQLGAKALPAGTIIFPKIGAAIATEKKRILVQPSAYDNNVMGVVPGDEIESRFLYYWFLTVKLQDLANIGPVPSIRKSTITGLQCPLPPPSEQRRIVEILDQADALRKLRAEADAKAERILPALFIKMFGDPRSWDTHPSSRPLGDLVNLASGATPSKRNEEFWGGDVPWVSPKDMKVDFIVSSQDHVTATALDETNLKIVDPGNVLLVVRGMILAHSVPVALTEVPVTINQDMKALVPKTEDISGKYIWAALKVAKPLLRSLVRTAAHGTRKLDTPDLLKLRIVEPTARQIEKCESAIKTHRDLLAASTTRQKKLNLLFNVVIHRAFTGDLTASWREAHMKELLQEMEQQAKALKSGTDTEVQA